MTGPVYQETFRTGAVDLTHGGGGRAMSDLIEDLFHRYLKNPILDQGHDAAVFDAPPGRLVMSTDAHVISPLFFPGGDIGALSVHGTLNDVAMAGARPISLTAGFILEEGFPLADLEAIVISMAKAAREAGVPIVSGDTKVVEKGKGDGVFITTAGVGVLPGGVSISPRSAKPGQAVLISGSIGDHGVAILSKRENLAFETEIRSDSAALHGLVAEMIAAVPEISVLRDPTRGGLATALNEIAHASGVGIVLEEDGIPVNPDVQAACEILGLDPLYVANEGKLICICDEVRAPVLLNVMQGHPLGQQAARIGTIVEDPDAMVVMNTSFGGARVVDWLSGEQLPRIC
ncbi:hydrogenase expression/formation protein HypE [Roseibium sp. RKSG952]|uniref:hydrogenase expression/formation protein HypE n=1 Tax=Roseibium sp. RKSG952 TaxID=2529384 RepID=UPI0012BC20DF|nr:hydrogenase expression/formation protein HypE [Roseibium sp. RKSG952]MTI00184.1 hydrogenase expression/formation protein HypE [Roseibium sp. RKSG952]